MKTTHTFESVESVSIAENEEGNLTFTIEEKETEHILHMNENTALAIARMILWKAGYRAMTIQEVEEGKLKVQMRRRKR